MKKFYNSFTLKELEKYKEFLVKISLEHVNGMQLAHDYMFPKRGDVVISTEMEIRSQGEEDNIVLKLTDSRKNFVHIFLPEVFIDMLIKEKLYMNDYEEFIRISEARGGAYFFDTNFLWRFLSDDLIQNKLDNILKLLVKLN